MRDRQVMSTVEVRIRVLKVVISRVRCMESKKMQDRHRQAECDVYDKPIKRNKKTHKDLSLPDSEMKSTRKSAKSSGNCDLPIPEEITESVNLVRKSMMFTQDASEINN